MYNPNNFYNQSSQDQQQHQQQQNQQSQEENNYFLTDNTQQNQYYLQNFQQTSDFQQQNIFYQNINQQQQQNHYQYTLNYQNDSYTNNINNNNNNTQYIFPDIVEPFMWNMNGQTSTVDNHQQLDHNNQFQSPFSSPTSSIIEYTSEEFSSESHSDNEWTIGVQLTYNSPEYYEESIEQISSPPPQPPPTYVFSANSSPQLPPIEQLQQHEKEKPRVKQNIKSPKLSINKKAAKESSSPRLNKSLKSICDSFLEEYDGNVRRRIKIEELSQKINVDNRRFYEIIKVMQCLGLIEKEGKNEYYWIGRDKVFNNIHSIYHSSKNYLNDEPQFACEKCRLSSQQRPNSPVSFEEVDDTGISRQCKQIIKLFFLNEKFSCKDASGILNPEKKAQGKRIYDIVNILYSLQLVSRVDSEEKAKKHYYIWKGPPSKEDLSNQCIY